MTPVLPRDRIGREYGTAAMLAALLSSPERAVTAARVRDWARRSRNPNDPLHGMLPAIRIPGARTGTTWYLLSHAAAVERATRPAHVRCDHTLVAQVAAARNPVEHT